MLRNYFKIAWRTLLKHKGFTFINITGLAIGFASCILITLYIIHETSYDKYLLNSENIYRVVGEFNEDGVMEKGIHHSAPVAQTLEADFGEVDKAGRILDIPLFNGAGNNEIRVEGEIREFHEEGFAYADQSIIDIFNLTMIYGDASSVLKEPNTLVISNKKAKKYFMDQNPVGQSIILNGDQASPFKITGVMEDFPSNSHMDYDFFLTLSGVEFGEGEQTRWSQFNYYTYVQLKPTTNIVEFNEKLTSTIRDTYLIPFLKTIDDASWAEGMQFTLQPITAIHLYSSDIYEDHTRRDIRIIWLFGTIAIFILIIACINFINFSTARSANRAVEVGLRKVSGSFRRDLVVQFLTESTLVTFLAFGCGLLLAKLILPYFNSLAGKSLTFPELDGWLIPASISMALLIGFLAGIYPALYLSGFKPIQTLKGNLSKGSKSKGLRSALVVFQFTTAIILVVGTMTISRQMNFILTEKVGFEKDQVIQIYGTNMLGDRIETFKSELKNLIGVKNASISDYLPIEGTKRNQNGFYYPGRSDPNEGVGGQNWIIDEDYLETLGIQLQEGRNFSNQSGINTKTVIINRKMAEQLGLKDPVGKALAFYAGEFEIIGVVEDFHFETLRDKVTPVAMLWGSNASIISVKANTDDIPDLLDAMESKWKEFAPNAEFRYAFMDVSYANMYADVQRVRGVFTSFAVLAILVACLGLLALSAFLVEQREKELSIRKILGASVQSLFQLVTGHFVGLIFISIVIAIPIAFFMMQNWLEDFAYRIDISWDIFAWAAASSVFIALLTISYHAIRSAFVNPVINLRSE